MVLHTTIKGDGDSIVFLHSGAETSETDYQEQKLYFQKEKQVVMLDLSGHGQSGAGDFETIEEYIDLAVKDLYDTCIHFELESVHFVSSSSGSLIALAFSKRYPAMVRSLTMSGLIPEKTEAYDSIMAEDQRHKKQVLTNPEADAYFSKLHVKSDWRKFVSLAIDEDWYPFELARNFDHLKGVPTMVVCGGNALLEVEGVSFYKKHFPFIHAAVIPFGGHLVHNDQPQLFNHIVNTFIKTL